MASMRLELALPEFAEELRSLLLVSKVPELAIQVSELIIARRCSCDYQLGNLDGQLGHF